MILTFITGFVIGGIIGFGIVLYQLSKGFRW